MKKQLILATKPYQAKVVTAGTSKNIILVCPAQVVVAVTSKIMIPSEFHEEIQGAKPNSIQVVTAGTSKNVTLGVPGLGCHTWHRQKYSTEFPAQVVIPGTTKIITPKEISQ